MLTALHEIGHALGLDPSDAAGSISPGQSFTGRGLADATAILERYAQADAPATATDLTGPLARDPAVVAAPGIWAERVLSAGPHAQSRTDSNRATGGHESAGRP